MFKNLRVAICTVILFACILNALPSSAKSAIYPSACEKKLLTGNGVTVDISNRWLGYIMVRHENSSANMKAVKVYDGKTYQYHLPRNGEYATIPLSEGNGDYMISVYKQVKPEKNEYSRVFHQTVNVFLPDPFSVFRIPNQYVWFTEESALVKKANELCARAADDLEKVKILYDYVSGRILYDYVKAATIKPPYLPDADKILEIGRGICFDSSVLLAAMLRAQGIPAKLAIGQLNTNGLTRPHAWNKVFIDGNWLKMDPTYNLVASISHPDYVAERVY